MRARRGARARRRRTARSRRRAIRISYRRTARGPQRAERLLAVLVRRPVDDQDAVEVVELVLDDPRGEPSSSRRTSLAVLGPCPRASTRVDRSTGTRDALEREAALVVGRGLLAALGDDRVDERARPRPRPAAKTKTRRSTPTWVAASPTPCASCISAIIRSTSGAGRRRTPRRRAPSSAAPGRGTGGSARARAACGPRLSAALRLPRRTRPHRDGRRSWSWSWS